MSIASLVESLEWLLKHAEGSHVEIDIYTVKKVLDVLKAATVALAVAPVFTPVASAPKAVIVVCGSGGCTVSARPRIHTRATHRNNDPFGRSHLDEHHTRGLYR